MTIKTFLKIGLLILLTPFAVLCGVSEIEIRLGVLEDGSASREWLAALEPRLATEEFAAVKARKKPLGAAEKKWLALLADAARAWSARRANLQIPFGKTKAPEKLSILAGNQGGDDGFTYLENVICLELAALVENYGDAASAENRARLFRILDHEYTHLLHHEWFRRHPPDLSTPFGRALRDLLAEGIGNYRSLSAKWLDERGTLTARARAALDELAPVFAERLTRLRHARTAEEEAVLTENLSRGQFERKWGALTIALWLAEEAQGDERKLRRWIERGPRGVIRLARKHLPARLKKDFLK